MIDQTGQRGTIRPNTQGRPGHIYEYDFGETIGRSINGNTTSRLRVIVDSDGRVVSAFPY